MEASIPFCDGLSLGLALDVTKQPFKQGPLLVPDDFKPVDFRVNLTTAQYCVVSSIEDVCNVLQIPLAYVLKVEAGLINDNMVSACINNAEDSQTICTIFRLSFLQQKQYLPQDMCLNLDALRSASDGNQAQSISEDTTKDPKPDESISEDTTKDPKPDESISEDTTKDPKPDESISSATHWVKALELGNELIVICKISTPERDELSSTFRKLTENLGGYRGLLELRQISGLEEFAKKMDKKLKKAHYSHMNLHIEYCTYTELQCAPANLTDMVSVMKEFLRKCEAWTDIYQHTTPFVFNKGPMIWKRGNYKPQEKGVLERLSNLGHGKQQEYSVQYFHVPSMSTEVDSGDGDSIEVVASESDSVHYLRAVIQSFENDDVMVNSFNMVQYPATSQNKLISLHKVLLRNMKAIEKLQRFLSSDIFISKDHMDEGKKLLKDSYAAQLTMVETIKEHNLITVPTEEQLKTFSDSDSSQNVDQYIERVTSKLPPGPDLDLLIIGKTGHGKSSTGNSILGQNKFKASASGESETTTCGVGWTLVDGRTIKVVDTPGVCDTRVDSDKSSIDIAIHAISDAIVQCPNGFHALLLVIRFGQRMTIEERKAIGMLKCILGDDIIKAHCVCVVTHGDNFKTEMKGQKTFKDWCKSQSGFLKDVFEECQYRCVLFNNKSEDLKEIKSQVIELVANVDGLSSGGTRYTNSLFEFAMNERQKVIVEDKVPEVDEKVMRDVQLVLEHLDKMIKGSDEVKTFESDLENLKYTVDNLKNQVNSIEGERMEMLIHTVFSLSQAVHAKMDEMANKSPTEEKAVSATPDVSSQGAAQNVAQAEFTENLKPLKENLVEIKKEIDPKSDEVNERVTQQVEEKVKQEKNCFPGLSWVIVKDGSQKMMRDLNVGDEILVRREDGQVALDKVYMFGHHDEKVLADFLVFETDLQRVFASEDHLVHCFKNGLEVCLPARLIREDDELIILSGKTPIKQKVKKICLERHTGLYAPFTSSGTLIVNGALMSCYVDVLPPAKAHKLLKPIRKLYQISPRALQFINRSKRGVVVPPWAKMFLKLKKRR